MVLLPAQSEDLLTSRGPMRTHLFRPAREGVYPGVIFYSEIFQLTEPIRRLAAFFAGHGYLVAVPEVYHEFEPAGTVLGYDQAGSDRGNALKYTKTPEQHDEDRRVLLDALAARPECSGRFGAVGVCLGGHLAFRAALDPRILGMVSFYATDLHSATLGRGDDSLARAEEIRGDVMMVWGRQDPHVPTEGRMRVLARLNEAGTRLEWHEVNGAHAFLRDEGLRFDAVLSHTLLGLSVSFLQTALYAGASCRTEAEAT